MGVDFVALIPHNKTPEELVLLIEKVQSNALPALKRAIEFTLSIYPDIAPWIKEWDCIQYHKTEVSKAFAEEGYILLEGPAEFSLDFNPQLCATHQFFDWASFLTNKDIQIVLRDVCRELCLELGTNKAIYIPDSAFKASRVSTAV